MLSGFWLRRSTTRPIAIATAARATALLGAVLAATLAAAIPGAASAQRAQTTTPVQLPRTILFIGNSFTQGAHSPLRNWHADRVTDLNGAGYGGVPALFKSFTQQAGLDYEVALETRGGTGLDFHLAEKLGVVTAKPWDTVVMHGFSLLDQQKPRVWRRHRSDLARVVVAILGAHAVQAAVVDDQTKV